MNTAHDVIDINRRRKASGNVVKLPMPGTSPPRLLRLLDRAAQMRMMLGNCSQGLASVESTVAHYTEELTALSRALQTEVRRRQELEEQLCALKQREKAIRHAAFHDPLTRLPNRALFNDRLTLSLRQAQRHGWMLAVMFIDLDDFKRINDTYGHLVGDKVLSIIAERLTKTMRADDTVSRHGGDEFLFLLSNLKNEKDAITVAKKILQTVAEPCQVHVNQARVSLSVTPSIGIAMFPNGQSGADALIKSADTAMYQAKRAKSGYFVAT